MTDAKTHETTTIAFADVADVDRPFPRWATILIVSGISCIGATIAISHILMSQAC